MATTALFIMHETIRMFEKEKKDIWGVGKTMYFSLEYVCV